MEQGHDGLVCAYVLDGKGSGKLIGWEEIRAWQPGSEAIWVHLDRAESNSQQWITDESGIPSIVGEAFLADASRPRSTRYGEGLLLNWRGVNRNEGAKPEDMISIKVWVEPGRVITTRHRHLMAIDDVRESLEDPRFSGPLNVGDLMVSIADKLLDRVEPTIDKLQNDIDAIEIEANSGERVQRGTQVDLSGLRIQAIGLRRYLAPQRDVFSRLPVEEFPLLDEDHRIRLREIGDRITRMVEDLDAARERASVTQDDITQRLSERQERATLILTVVAAIFLPLGLLTGLLGINTGGMPLEEQEWGFWAVAGVLALITAVATAAIWIFRRAGLL